MLFRKRCRHLRPPPPLARYIHTGIRVLVHTRYEHTDKPIHEKKEMHASYTVISMISTFAIKRFAMYLYITHIHIYYYIYHAIVLNRLSD